MEVHARSSRIVRSALSARSARRACASREAARTSNPRARAKRGCEPTHPKGLMPSARHNRPNRFITLISVGVGGGPSIVSEFLQTLAVIFPQPGMNTVLIRMCHSSWFFQNIDPKTTVSEGNTLGLKIMLGKGQKHTFLGIFQQSEARSELLAERAALRL